MNPSTPDAPTDRMATERTAAERIAVNEQRYQRAAFRRTPLTDTGVFTGTQAPTEERTPLPAFKRGPGRALPQRPTPEQRSPEPAWVAREPDPPRRSESPDPPWVDRSTAVPAKDRSTAAPALPRSTAAPAPPRAARDLPPIDLHEMRLRLTAEPAMDRAEGHRVRPLAKKIRRRRAPVPWGLIGVGALGVLAIAGAIAVAIAWLPRLDSAAGPDEAPAPIIGPHPPEIPGGR